MRTQVGLGLGQELKTSSFDPRPTVNTLLREDVFGRKGSENAPICWGIVLMERLAPEQGGNLGGSL